MTARGLQAVFQTFAKGPVSGRASLPLAFLEKLRSGGPWVLTAIVDGPTTTITARTPDEVDAFVRRYDGKPRTVLLSQSDARTTMSKKAAKIDIAAIEFALADLDPHADETSEGRKGALRQAAQGVQAEADCGDR